MPKRIMFFVFRQIFREGNIINLVKAAKKLGNIPFVFAGKGELENEVNSADNIKNVGFKTGDELRNIIEKALFTVLPAEWWKIVLFCYGVAESYDSRTRCKNRQYSRTYQ